jgi:hypothetical protein
MGHNQGRPAALVNGFSYQALFTAQIGPGHAGSYSTELWSQGGAATLYLDGRPLARTPPTVPGATAPIVLRLSGHRQLLQLAFEANGQQGGIMGAALFRLDLHGRQAFLPWPWFSPPSPWSGLARWPAS